MRFLFICEGSSDAPLADHIQRLLIQDGQPDPNGEAWHHGRRVADKIRQGLNAADSLDLLFVHRDADNAGAEARYREIEAAVRDVVQDGMSWIGVVPVRMTEAWLLLDEAAIRNVVGKPGGRAPLDLPAPRHAERVADPRERLKDALLTASGNRGRRRRRFDREFPRLRRRLLQDLPIGGELERLESWTRFRDDTIAASRARSRTNGSSGNGCSTPPSRW